MRTYLKIVLCWLLIFTPAIQAAQIIRYVDPDAAGGGTGVDWANAYTALQTCLSTEANDLQAAGNYMTVYCGSSGGTDDTTNVTSLTQANYNTAAANYIEIIGFDFPADGVFDDTKYVLHNQTNNGTALTISADYVRVHNLQVKVTAPNSYNFDGIYVVSVGTTDIRIDSCIIKGVCSGTGGATGIRVNDLSAVVKIYNTIVYDFVSGTDNGFAGIYNYCSTTDLYNCTVYNCYAYGISRATGTVTAKNCAVGLTNDDFNGTITVDYCCSDDGDGTNAQGPSGGAWANEFVNPGTDFDLLAGGNCIGNGTDNPGAGLYSDDIIGTARSSTWDIGAFEYVAPAAGGGAQVIFVTEDED